VKYARATSVWINLDYIDGEVGLSLGQSHVTNK
jgi:hypothetical protein